MRCMSSKNEEWHTRKTLLHLPASIQCWYCVTFPIQTVHIVMISHTTSPRVKLPTAHAEGLVVKIGSNKF